MSNSFRAHRDTEGKMPTRYYSDKQEKSVVKAVGGKQTANSGATMWQKSDVNTDNWSLECKTKTKESKSISIKQEWFEKQKQEALFMGKEYQAIVFSFGPNLPNYYIIDELTFKELLEYQNNSRENT